MQIKFPELNSIKARFESQNEVKKRAQEISELASKCLKMISEPKNFKRILKSTIENLRV
jgi:hypothetical protein